MNGSKVGLDGRQATKALNSIEKTYNEVYLAHKRIQDQFIIEIGRSWYGQDAVDFVAKKAGPAILEIYEEIERVYQSVNDTITQNAINFENKHDTHVFVPVTHTKQNVTYDYNVVKPEDAGFIGIKSINGLKFALTGVIHYRKTMDYQLMLAQKSAKESGFYGENQQEKLNSSMEKIHHNVTNICESLSKTLAQKIEETEAEEKRIAQTNANSF